MIVGLSICCFVLVLWIVIWAFFAFTDEDEDEIVNVEEYEDTEYDE